MKRATPASWRGSVDGEEVEVLPLVDGEAGPIGWCTAAFALDAPDIEVMCGGINTKQPTHAGIWRQGNLLHFGFEPSPAQLNDAGRALLLNCIEYVSKFTEDRPVAVSPTPLGTRPMVPMRRSVDYALDKKDVTAESLARYFGEPWNAKLRAMTAAEAAATVREHYHRIRDDGAKLTFDEDAIALGIPLDGPEFFTGVRRALADGDERAAALLARMIPEGPAEPSAWAGWLDDNAPYLFFCDGAGYVWLIDPLAKKRGVPSAELRGPRRADR